MEINKETIFSAFKFKDLKIYGSAEWLAGKKKKYRCVFDKSEATYIYAEFSLYNKKFDEADWELPVNLKAYALKGARRIELCSLDVNKRVSKDENLIYIREGWGNKKPGVYWKKGTYLWEASIEGKVIGSNKFYIENVGKVTTTNNPYFSIESLKLYESGDDGVEKENRSYYTKFDNKSTRFVFIEMNFKNLVYPQPWQCELHFNFYNDARQLKGETTELRLINSDEEHCSITTGWGSDTNGTWFEDKYTVEVIFMDQLIAVLPYEVGGNFEKGIGEAYFPEGNGAPAFFKLPTEENFQTLEEVMQSLDSLVGLQTIKTKVKEYAQYLKFIKLRMEKGFDESSQVQMHAVFTGNPGTGKTTVAKMLGKIYQKMGLLSKGHVHEVDRADLVGEYIGQTAPKVKEAIKKAKGGILFIDEAYSLARSAEDNKDFGREVIEILVKEMSDGTGDISIIFAGYPAEMKTFMNANAGLKSRVTLHFEFPDYLPQELADIAEYAATEQNVHLTKQSKAYLYDKIVKAYRERDRFFGNARMVHKLIEQAKMNLGLRVMQSPQPSQLTKEELSMIQVEDFEKIYKAREKSLPDIPVDEDLLKESLEELNSLIGLTGVKKEINEIVNLVRYYRESDKEVLNAFSLHTVFTGNPGTGKTTVARIVAKIFRALGILERGHLVEGDRQSIVAGFVGQTAIKTTEKIDKAIGGVLFIDEAYALNQRGRGDFGSEAIETLLKRMEDQSGEFAVIVAGYPQPMKEFIESNPGLKSRFDRTIHFEDFSVEELLEIVDYHFKKENYTVEEDARSHIEKYIQVLVESKDKFFGNGRVMRNIVKEAIKEQNLRLAKLSKSKRTKKAMQNIISDDVKGFTSAKAWELGDKSRVGFRRKMD